MDSKILETIFRGKNGEKYNTEDCLTEYYKRKGYNAFKAAQYAQENSSNFVVYANNEIEKSKCKNTPFYLKEANKDIVLINADYYKIKELHKKLQSLEWRDFEYVSSDVLEYCFGAYDVETSQATRDGGFDFQGKIPVLAIRTREQYAFIEVYGQSKQHADNVGIDDIKSFVAFANSKKRNYIHNPQLFMFFTTSDFALSALKELSVNGFLGLSGFQLSSLIFNHSEILKEKSELIKIILQ